MKLKQNKGITLIALIITIIILLILAVVTIMAVNGDGIIGKAKQAKADYQNAQAEEQNVLDRYLAEMEGLVGNNTTTDETSVTWTNNGDGTFTSSYGITVTIGDKVAYDEGTGKTSSIDSSFVMKDMEWRILDIEEDGTIELISTQPTDSTLTLSGEEGWLKGEENLDTLCNDLYANGEGVTARSLKVEDIDKLAGIITEEDKKALESNYGILWRYKYASISGVGRIRYSKSEDNGSTWTSYASTDLEKFYYPGWPTLNSGNLSERELEYTVYSYTIEDKTTQTVADGISMASLITQGLNNTNDAASGSNKIQWLSSRYISCSKSFASYGLRTVSKDGNVGCGTISTCNGIHESPACMVRPVVSLPSNVQLNQVDGIWQMNI